MVVFRFAPNSFEKTKAEIVLEQFNSSSMGSLSEEQLRINRNALHDMFATSNWGDLTKDDKLKCLQALENDFAFQQGRPALPVYPTEKEGYGYYSPRDNAIYVNENMLDHGNFDDTVDETHPARKDANMQLFDTVAHEGYHGYENYALKHPEVHADKHQLTEWGMNQGRYFKGKDDGEKYLLQPKERDAWAYGANRTREAFDGIEARNGREPGRFMYEKMVDWNSYDASLERAERINSDILSQMKDEMKQECAAKNFVYDYENPNAVPSMVEDKEKYIAGLKTKENENQEEQADNQTLNEGKVGTQSDEGIEENANAEKQPEESAKQDEKSDGIVKEEGKDETPATESAEEEAEAEKEAVDESEIEERAIDEEQTDDLAETDSEDEAPAEETAEEEEQTDDLAEADGEDEAPAEETAEDEAQADDFAETDGEDEAPAEETAENEEQVSDLTGEETADESVAEETAEEEEQADDLVETDSHDEAPAEETAEDEEQASDLIGEETADESTTEETAEEEEQTDDLVETDSEGEAPAEETAEDEEQANDLIGEETADESESKETAEDEEQADDLVETDGENEAPAEETAEDEEQASDLIGGGSTDGSADESDSEENVEEEDEEQSYSY